MKTYNVDILETVFNAEWTTEILNGDYTNRLRKENGSYVDGEKIGTSSVNGWPILKFITPSGKTAIADMGTCELTIK
jgi:hypothetical protein